MLYDMQVLKASGGWAACECENKVWYYTSTGALRAGPRSIADSGHKFGEGDVILLDLDIREGELRIARGVDSAEQGRVGFSSRSQPLSARRPRTDGCSSATRQDYTFECLPVIPINIGSIDPSAGQAYEGEMAARKSVRETHTHDDLAARVCVAVTMFFDGACCELLPLEPTEGCVLPDHKAESTALWEARDNWAHRVWPLFPPFSLSSSNLLVPAGGPPSVPRLSLTGVGDVSGLSGNSRGGPGSGRGPSSGGREGPISGGRDGSSSDRRLPSPDPAGPLSSRSGGTIASNSPGRNVGIGGEIRGALGLTGPRPSPRLTGGGLGSSRTPRGLSITSHSPQITPRNQHQQPGSPTRRPASPRGLTSPRVSERGTLFSPRVPSPRTTPRGSLVPSPRKPMEAMPATLTLQQHQKMESMLNRIDTLEAMVTRTLSENRRLQTELVSFKRATTNSDVCEVGEEDCAAGAGVSSQDVLALDHESAQPRSPPVLILGTRRVKPASVTVAIDTEQASATARANRAIKFRDEEDNGKRQRPVNFLDIFTEGSHAHVHTADAGTKTGAALGAAERVTGVVKETIGTGEASRSSQRAFKLSDIWEVNPADLTRTRCIGRGACGTVWEGNWRRSNVAIKDLDTPAGVESGEEREEDGLMDHDREMLAAFRGEVAQLSCLRHPNILAFYGAVSQGDKLCMIVELMDRDVRGFLKTDASRVSLEARVRIGVGAMSGVLYLHSQLPQVVHRDIKPENLLLSHGDTVVKVCLFSYIYVYTNTHMHMHTHKHIHTCIYIKKTHIHIHV